MQVSSPKISIIVPVYNIPDPIFCKCVKSLMDQTFNDVEFIFIDDCSPNPGNLSFLKTTAEDDDRIRIISLPENGGVSNARNVGLNAARGEFIGFVDADDFIDPDMMDVLYRLAVQTGADIAACASRIESADHTWVESHLEMSEFEINSEASQIDAIQGTPGALWGKLFRKTAIGDSRMNTACRHYEDYLFLWEVILKSKKIVGTDSVFYNYTYCEGSATKAKTDAKKFCRLMGSFTEMIKFTDNLRKVSKSDKIADYLYFYISSLSLFDLSNFGNRELRNDNECKKSLARFIDALDVKSHYKTLLGQRLIAGHCKNPFDTIGTFRGALAKLACLYAMYHSQLGSPIKAASRISYRLRTGRL